MSTSNIKRSSCVDDCSLDFDATASPETGTTRSKSLGLSKRLAALQDQRDKKKKKIKSAAPLAVDESPSDTNRSITATSSRNSLNDAPTFRRRKRRRRSVEKKIEPNENLNEKAFTSIEKVFAQTDAAASNSVATGQQNDNNSHEPPQAVATNATSGLGETEASLPERLLRPAEALALGKEESNEEKTNKQPTVGEEQAAAKKSSMETAPESSTPPVGKEEAAEKKPTLGHEKGKKIEKTPLRDSWSSTQRVVAHLSLSTPVKEKRKNARIETAPESITPPVEKKEAAKEMTEKNPRPEKEKAEKIEKAPIVESWPSTQRVVTQQSSSSTPGKEKAKKIEKEPIVESWPSTQRVVTQQSSSSSRNEQRRKYDRYSSGGRSFSSENSQRAQLLEEEIHAMRLENELLLQQMGNRSSESSSARSSFSACKKARRHSSGNGVGTKNRSDADKACLITKDVTTQAAATPPRANQSSTIAKRRETGDIDRATIAVAAGGGTSCCISKSMSSEKPAQPANASQAETKRASSGASANTAATVPSSSSCQHNSPSENSSSRRSSSTPEDETSQQQPEVGVSEPTNTSSSASATAKILSFGSSSQQLNQSENSSYSARSSSLLDDETSQQHPASTKPNPPKSVSGGTSATGGQIDVGNMMSASSSKPARRSAAEESVGARGVRDDVLETEAESERTSSRVNILAGRDMDDILTVYPPAEERHDGCCVTLHVQDYQRLEPWRFFNETLVNLWILWWNKHNCDPSVVILASFFFATKQGRAVDSCWGRQLQRVNIFTKKLILIPIYDNEGFHWSLMAVTNPGWIAEHNDRCANNKKHPAAARFPSMLYLNPIRSGVSNYHARQAKFDTIKHWLNQEWMRLGYPTTTPFTNVTVWERRVPGVSSSGDNIWDTGPFVCRYIMSMNQIARRACFTCGEANFPMGGGQNVFRSIIVNSPEFNFGVDEIDGFRKKCKVLFRRLTMNESVSWKEALPLPRRPTEVADDLKPTTASRVTCGPLAPPRFRLQAVGQTKTPSDRAGSHLPPYLVQVAAETIDWEQERREMDKVFEEQACDNVAGLPEIDAPAKLVSSVLPHQLQGIRWLYKMETSNVQTPFIRKKDTDKGDSAFYCRLTCKRIQEPPRIEGSILADDMGLGKTIQTIGLILLNPPPKDSEARMTLIVCPKSVISNWVQQIREHVDKGVLRGAIYEGPDRRVLLMKIKGRPVDILLATYEIVTSDMKAIVSVDETKRGMRQIGTIYQFKYHRIVLDEAHKIRNKDSQVFNAVMRIRAKHKVCLTGTPFVNKPEDIHSLMKFLNVSPIADYFLFKQYITDPIKNRKRAGLKRLRAAMATVCLRRTKRAANLQLVQKVVQLHRVEFEEGPHKEIHDNVYMTAKGAFDACLGSGRRAGGTHHFRTAFEMLLRTRQSCCHGQLIPFARRQRAATIVEELKLRADTPLSPTEGLLILERLLDKDGVAASAYLDLRNGDDDVDHDFTTDAATDDEGEADGPEPELGPSPKMKALLNEIRKMEENEKGVVFSQFVRFLNKVDRMLASHGIESVRIVGSMTAAERLKAMDIFSRDDGVKVILCSLNAAGTGINLTRGNVCFLMDPWWNEAMENQAMDRVHRVGQIRTVRIIRFVMANSIEERFIAYQKAKAALGKGSLERISKADERAAKLTAIKDLFEIDKSTDEDWTED